MLPNEYTCVEEGTWAAWLPPDVQAGPGQQEAPHPPCPWDVHSFHASGFGSNFKDTAGRELGGAETIWTIDVLSN